MNLAMEIALAIIAFAAFALGCLTVYAAVTKGTKDD